MIDIEKAAETVATILVIADTTLNIIERLTRRRSRTSQPVAKRRRHKRKRK